MSTLIKTLTKTGIASIAAAALLAGGVGAAHADNYRKGWHGNNGKEVVVIHKNARHAKRHSHQVKVVRHVYRPQPVKVVHHYYKPKPVRVVHHHYTPPRAYRYSPANYQLSKQTGGAIIGALLGAATGSQFGKGNGRIAAVLTGTVIGAVIGGNVGQSMDRQDHAQVQNALENSRTGNSVNWNNPDNGNQYTVTPTRTYRTAANGDCRDYDAWVFIGGYERKVTGTACRAPDGAWQQVQG